MDGLWSYRLHFKPFEIKDGPTRIETFGNRIKSSNAVYVKIVMGQLSK